MRIRNVLTAGLIAAGASMVAIPAVATPGNGDNVTLCHRTDSDSNPYVVITVDPDSVFKQGHDGHDGPVWNPSLKSSHTKWGDIIPPFDYTAKHGHSSTQAHYDGKNWTSDGRAIYDNGCTAPTHEQPSSPPTSPSESPSHSQTPTESPTQTPPSSPSPSETPSHSQTPSTPPATPTSSPPTSPPHSPTQPPTQPPTTPPTQPPVTPPVPSHSPTPPIVCAGCPLPHTGFPVWPLAAVGGAMVLLGAGLLRRRF